MNKKNSIVANTLAAALGIILVVIIWIYCDANISHYTRYMDSDIASDTLLVEVLSESGFSIPDTWYGSTEKCIISAPNLGAFIYIFTGNLNFSMGLACAIMTIMLALAMVYFYKSVGFSNIQIIIATLIPFMLSRSVSDSLKMIYIYASYYVSHLIVMFIVLGFYAQALRNGYVLKKRHIVLSILFAILNGMQGMHGILFLYAPMLGTEISRVGFKLITKRRVAKDKFIILWAFCLAVISYISVQIGTSYVQSPSRNIRHSIEKLLKDVFPDIIETMGLSGFTAKMIWVFIILGILGYIIVIFNSVRCILKEKEYEQEGQLQLLATLPVLFSFIVPILAATFTTSESTGRYYIGQMFLMGAGYAVVIGVVERHIAKNVAKNLIVLLIAIPVFVYGINSVSFYYNNLIANDQTDTSKNMQIINWLKENGCEYGYADFLKANEITVVSNDTVKIRALDSMTDLNGCKWLTDTRWYPPTKSTDGLTAYVLLPEEIEEFQAFLDTQNPTVVAYKVFDNLEVYILDRDYSMWID